MSEARPPPRPRPRRKQPTPTSGVSPQTGGADNESDFFVARRPGRASADARVSVSPGPCSDDSGEGSSTPRRRNKRQKLPKWVNDSVTASPTSQTRAETEESPPEESTSAEATPQPNRARSVSITPPPQDNNEELREFARNAVSRVFMRQESAPSAPQVVPEASSDDSSFDINPDLAPYYKGANAAQLRERALARERDLQRAHVRAPTRERQQETITVDDSSDEEAPRGPAADAAGIDDTALQVPGDLLSLTLRGPSGQEVHARVRPSTRFATILAHFLDTCADTLEETQRTRACLQFDGERLPASSAVGDFDIEDEDLVEVIW